MGCGASTSSSSDDVKIKPNPRSRKRALLIGINYNNSENQLQGCINDIHNINKLIKGERFGYEDVKIMHDDLAPGHDGFPSRANIIKAFQWLVKGVKKGDRLFLHYSGHGTQVDDEDGHKSALDDAIVPVDFNDNGIILDEELNRYLVTPLPAGASLTAIFDCCHSGTIMDLPLTFTPTSFTNKESIIYVRRNTEETLKATKELFKDLLLLPTTGKGKAGKAASKAKAKADAYRLKHLISLQESGLSESTLVTGFHETEASIFLLSGCMDSQTSADAPAEHGKYEGAMTHSLLRVLGEGVGEGREEVKILSLSKILSSLHKEMKKGSFKQIPQLSISHEMNIEEVPFMI